jgi:hypothetical protein
MLRSKNRSKYDYDYQIKEDEVGVGSTTNGRNKKYIYADGKIKLK